MKRKKRAILKNNEKFLAAKPWDQPPPLSAFGFRNFIELRKAFAQPWKSPKKVHWWNADPVPAVIKAVGLGPKKTFDSGDNYIAALKRKGFTRLGGGFYSGVYAKEGSDRVLKVCTRAGTDGWAHYIAWATKRGHAGKFAPKVFSYKYYKGANDNFYVASMERLDKTVSRLDGKHPLVVLPSLVQYALASNNDNAKKLADTLQPGLMDFVKDFTKDLMGRKLFNGGRRMGVGSFDLHSENMMLRKDGSFVLTDPLSGADGPYLERIKLAT